VFRSCVDASSINSGSHSLVPLDVHSINCFGICSYTYVIEGAAFICLVCYVTVSRHVQSRSADVGRHVICCGGRCGE
jgi:hypothetical protein